MGALTAEMILPQGGPKIWHDYFVRHNFIKYLPTYEIISLSESEENF